MEFNDVVFSRKSVRTYTGEKIASEQLEAIISAGNAGPVGMGRFDTMHFTVIEDTDLLARISEAACQKLGVPTRNLTYGAPTLVVVSVKPAGEAPNNVEYSNAAIAAHTMGLAAVNAGVGACLIWGAVMGMSANAALVAELGLPEGFVPCCGVALGATGDAYAPREIAPRVGVNRIG